MTTTAPRPSQASLLPERLVRDFRLWLPEPIRRWPEWARVGSFLFILIVVSVYLRSRELNAQFWMDEAITTGIASHSLTAIPGILRMDGSPPLYYFMLHIWMGWFGDGEPAAHALSLLCATLTIPAGYWAAHTMFGKRAALMAATMFAFSPFLTEYGQENRMYALMALWGLLATTGFVLGFVYRRRKYVFLFAAMQALMLYTHAWALFYGGGSFLALCIVYRLSDEEHRKNLIKDGILAYVGAGVLFLPWLPNFIYQLTHTAAPWDSSPRFGAPVQLSRDLVGGDAITAVILIAAAVGLAEFFVKRGRRTLQARVMWSLISITALTLGLAWLSSQITPAWVPRYFAPILGAVVLLAVMGMARAGVLGAIALVLSLVFLHDPGAFAPGFKSDVQNIAAQMNPQLNRGDLVVVGQPEQTPLAYYYIDRGVRFANTMQGIVKDPSYMDWVKALPRYKATNPVKMANQMINSLKPGQQLLYMPPLTEGVLNWTSAWTRQVRLRTAQWGAVFGASKLLKLESYAPENYHGAATVGNTAWLYKKL